MNLLRYCDPRQRFSAAIGWTVFAIILLAALAGANLAARKAEHLARADAELLLNQFAAQIYHGLAMSLETRQSILQATAIQIATTQDRGIDALRHHIEAVQAQFPEFVWLGVTDEQGNVIAATGGWLQNENVADQSWFQEGRQGAFIGDARKISLLKGLTPLPAALVDSKGFMAAVPIKQPTGYPIGVLGARLSWDWLAHQQKRLLGGLDAQRPLDLVLMTADNLLLMRPESWSDRTTLAKEYDLSESGAYILGRHHAYVRQSALLGWTVILRQDASTALARARTTHRGVFLIVLLAGLASAVTAVFATRALTQRLTALADQAQAVRQGTRENVAIPAGVDEISHIGATLAGLVNYLQQERQALALLNMELDARVMERTARIERMEREARHAAITRERLRLARALHDTLAHSLMALLTQIRLIRKLRDRLGPVERDEELARAEAAAASGLKEARAAISQMRHNDVGDAGLGAALQELLDRFKQRCSVAAMLETDIQAAGLADERTETVFRIVEEALHNVERHANATTVKVRLQWIESPAITSTPWDSHQPARVRVEVVDDGVGFDPAAPSPGHYGLQGIREQAELMGARCAVESQPNAGTRVILEFAV